MPALVRRACRQSLRIPAALRGRIVRCRGCRTRLAIVNDEQGALPPELAPPSADVLAAHEPRWEEILRRLEDARRGSLWRRMGGLALLVGLWPWVGWCGSYPWLFRREERARSKAP